MSRIPEGAPEVSDELRAGSSPVAIDFGGGALWVADSIGGTLLGLRSRATGKIRSVDSSRAALRRDVHPPGGVGRADADQRGGRRPRLDDPHPRAARRRRPGRDARRLRLDLGREPPRRDRVAGSVLLHGNRANDHPDRRRSDLAGRVGRLRVGRERVRRHRHRDRPADRRRRLHDPGRRRRGLARRRHIGAVARGRCVGDRAHGGQSRPGGVGRRGLDARPRGLLRDRRVADPHRPTTASSPRKVGGPDGATVVPDLATALPEVSADGLTYRFVLRSGIRYSNGEPVRPEDFRRGIGRADADAARQPVPVRRDRRRRGVLRCGRATSPIRSRSTARA